MDKQTGKLLKGIKASLNKAIKKAENDFVKSAYDIDCGGILSGLQQALNILEKEGAKHLKPTH